VAGKGDGRGEMKSLFDAIGAIILAMGFACVVWLASFLFEDKTYIMNSFEMVVIYGLAFIIIRQNDKET
jgi:hypothetical protein